MCENFESVFDYDICTRFRYQFYFQFEIIFHCNSFYIVLSYSLQKVTHNNVRRTNT